MPTYDRSNYDRIKKVNGAEVFSSAANDLLNWIAGMTPAGKQYNQQQQQGQLNQPQMQQPVQTSLPQQGVMIPEMPQSQGSILEDLIKNNQKYNVKSISHGPDGSAKVDFQSSANTVQGLGTQGQFQSQVGQSQQQPQGNQQQQNTPTTNNNVATQNNPTVRSLPKGPLGAFYPGSDTEQPGGMYKLLTLLAGAGGYRPSTETAQNAAILQQMMGEQPIQPTQQLDYQARMFGAKREALTGQVTAYNDQLKSLGETLTQVRQLPMNVRWGKEKEILSNMDKVHSNLGQTLKKLREFSSGQQEATQKTPKGATHYSPSQNKYYDAKGNEVK